MHLPETAAVDDACTTLEVGDGARDNDPKDKLSLTFVRNHQESKLDSSTVYIQKVRHFTWDSSHGWDGQGERKELMRGKEEEKEKSGQGDAEAEEW